MCIFREESEIIFQKFCVEFFGGSVIFGEEEFLVVIAQVVPSVEHDGEVVVLFCFLEIFFPQIYFRKKICCTGVMYVTTDDLNEHFFGFGQPFFTYGVFCAEKHGIFIE